MGFGGGVQESKGGFWEPRKGSFEFRFKGVGGFKFRVCEHSKAHCTQGFGFRWLQKFGRHLPFLRLLLRKPRAKFASP